jgi:hypothetical protein
VLDARERLNPPWRPSELLVTLTLRDKQSNRCRVKLSQPASTYDDPAVREYIERKRSEIPSPRPFPPPGDPLPAYVVVDGSPPVPKQPGIAISGDRVVELKERASCIVHGSFLLPIAKADLVRPEEGERQAAVVAIHLVVTGADHPAPFLQTLHVPVYGKVEPDQPAAGYFAFDLLSLFTPANRTETYFVYAFSREIMAGPQPFAFLARDALPTKEDT